MAKNRGKVTGVANIVRFNWHFYVIAGATILSLIVVQLFYPAIRAAALLLALAVFWQTAASLLVSYWVYDRSPLYDMNWLIPYFGETPAKIANINAGFDETTLRLRDLLPESDITAMDFFCAERHTEASIQRARKLVSPVEAKAIQTTNIDWPTTEFDVVLLFLSAHEIRDHAERAEFFRELKRILNAGGKIVVVEHLRDTANFLAYALGALHFHSRATWVSAFRAGGLHLAQERRFTPFLSVFTLQKSESNNKHEDKDKLEQR